MTRTEMMDTAQLVAVPFAGPRRSNWWLSPFLVLAVACAREAPRIVEDNARAHVGMLAGTIGSRPIGTPANARARAYIIDELRRIGFHVRVQEADARRHELGVTARVSNIIALLPGERSEAVGLISHYDSSAHAPGATDDALGVAVSLETARVFAARGRPHWSLFVIATDGEERGLLGAAALVNDREVADRLHAYINLDSIGSAGIPVLFETGPGNAWLVRPWARRAPYPRGGSYALEVYKLLPNDTDFSILKARDIPGLNFAPVGDSYAYHTARDTPERLSRQTLSRAGDNTLSILTALQEIDITQRSTSGTTFFDIGATVALSYQSPMEWLLAAAALALGVIVWVRFTADAIRRDGVLRWSLAFVWAWIGAAAVVASMAGTTWLVRAAREVYHPWYARPGRLFVLLILVGLTIGWSMVRLGQWLPGRAHPTRHPSLVWTVALPAWILMASCALWFAPMAAYLWMLPLLAAGAFLAPVPPDRSVAVRIASVLVLGVSATLWLRETHEILQFAVAVMGRMAIITPVPTYAAPLAAAGAMILPPIVAAFAAERRLARPWMVTSVLLVAIAGASGAVYMAPAYTTDQPLRRHVRALQEGDSANATWEVASVEPGVDLLPEAPAGWQPVSRPPAAPPAGIQAKSAAERRLPWSPLNFPFVFRTMGPGLGLAPASIGSFTLEPLLQGMQMRVSVIPSQPGLTVSFVLPPGLVPARTTLPGIVRSGQWTGSFVAPPAEGLTWLASFRAPVTEQQLRGTQITIASDRFPGGSGWQQLPAWLPQDNMVWTASAAWVLSVPSGPAIAPVPALR